MTSAGAGMKRLENGAQNATDLCEATTSSQTRNALQSLPPLAVVPDITAPKSSPERRFIMHDGVEDGVITQSESLVAELSSDRRIPKRVSNSFIETLKHDDFNPDDIRFDRIQPIEDLISAAHDGGRIQEFNLWKEEDGDQEVMLIVRLLRQIIADNQGFVGGQGIVNTCHSRCMNTMAFAYLALPTVTYSGR
jgi:hypothetical protein